MGASKRSIMTLYSGSDIYSHRVRLVLEAKGITYDTIDMDSSSKYKEELAECNPYCSVPTFADRDLVVYKSDIIVEYLDERFPHPPLQPVYPVAKARSRLMIYRINRDWYTEVNKINDTNSTEDIKRAARTRLINSITAVTPVFAEMKYFLSEEFSLIDCCIVPLLWRLPSLGVVLPAQAAPINEYAERMFALPSFQASLTDLERTQRM
jgi:stringent starvation protein A